MPQLNVTKSKWEKEFSAGKWNYLDFAPVERARSAVIGMLCQYYFPKGRILDVGCGLGTTADFLNAAQKKKYLGLDISANALKKAQAKKVKFQNIDFKVFESREKHDIILFNEVLYYMDEKSALEKALSILSKNGKVIVSLYHMKDKNYDRKIWRASRKFFKTNDAIDISGMVRDQKVTWRIATLQRRSMIRKEHHLTASIRNSASLRRV